MTASTPLRPRDLPRFRPGRLRLGGARAARPRAEPAPAAAPPAAPRPRRAARARARAPEAPVRTVARATLGAVGDVLMHEAVKRSAATHGRGAPDARLLLAVRRRSPTCSPRPT